MPESEKKKLTDPSIGSASPDKEKAVQIDADLYGDESELPIKIRKKKTVSDSPKKNKSKRKTTGKKKKRRFPGFSGSNAFRKRRRLFEIIDTSNEYSLFRPIKIFGRDIRFWPLILLAIIVLIVAMVFMNNSSVKVQNEQVTVVGLADDLENYRFLIISDLNGRRFGDKQSALLRTINTQNYNAVICLGDMVGKDGDAEPFYELLDGLPSSKQVFFICGDSDPGPYVEKTRDITGTLPQLVLEDWILGAIERGATYVDAPVCLTVGDSNIWLSPSSLMNVETSTLLSVREEQMKQEESGVLAGLQADYDTLPITSYRYRIAQNFYNAFSSMQEDDFYLVLSHEIPTDDFIMSAADHSSDDGKFMNEPDLLLAGHYCGGVWRLPLLGAFYIPDNMADRNGWFPAQDDVKGLSAVGETQIYISGGLSINGDTPWMAFRLMNQPEITVLTLTSTLPESMLTAQ